MVSLGIIFGRITIIWRSTMKLFYSPGVCSQAVHIALSEIGGNFEIEKVDLATKKTETGADFGEVNPLGYVPALKLDDGDVILEAPAILQYLADQNPETDLAPEPGSRERLRLQEHLNFVASEFHKSFGPFFAAVKPEGALLEQAMSKLRSRLAELDRRLADGRDYLMGERFTVADAYAFVVASWAGVVNLDMAEWPHVAVYVDRIKARPAVQAVLKREGLLH